MFVCLCKAISDRQIRTLAKDGAGLREIMTRCQAGADCGSCIGQLKQMIAEVQAEDTGPPPPAGEMQK